MARTNGDMGVVLDNGVVVVEGEALRYERTRMFLVRNEKTRKYAVYLRKGSGGCIFVRPIRKSGDMSTSQAHWTHCSSWHFVGSIVLCTAYRQKRVPRNPFLRGLLRLVREETRATHEWTQDIDLWGKEKWLHSDLWHILMERESRKSGDGGALADNAL